MEPVFFEAQGRADFGQIDDEVGLCRVPKQNMIFDSLVADSLVESVDAKSQQTLNCALSVDLL